MNHSLRFPEDLMSSQQPLVAPIPRKLARVRIDDSMDYLPDAEFDLLPDADPRLYKGPEFPDASPVPALTLEDIRLQLRTEVSVFLTTLRWILYRGGLNDRGGINRAGGSGIGNRAGGNNNPPEWTIIDAQEGRNNSEEWRIIGGVEEEFRRAMVAEEHAREALFVEEEFNRELIRKHFELTALEYALERLKFVVAPVVVVDPRIGVGGPLPGRWGGGGASQLLLNSLEKTAKEARREFEAQENENRD